MDEAVVCPNCGCAVVQPTTPQEVINPNDKPDIGLCILSALLPIFGVIYWPVKHKETPKKAMACGITGIVAWIVSFIILMSLGM